jgi:renalase
MEGNVDVLIIGAGMAGLCAANRLQGTGKTILMVDKSRGVGGRMATRRFGGAIFDHGAQFLTAKTSRYLQSMSQWEKQGLVEKWTSLARKGREGVVHYKGAPSMTALPKFLKGDLAVELSTRIVSIAAKADGWESVAENGSKIGSKVVVLTVPVPQALELLRVGQVALLPEVEIQLEKIQYDPCFAVMATLAGPSKLPASGYIEFSEGPILCVVDNQIKGVSPVPSITLHASPAYSRVNWKGDRETCGRELLAIVKDKIGAEIKEVQVHGWLYSKAQTTESSTYVVLNADASLIIAGDAFGGPQVEGAALSGWAAAEWVLHPSRVN